MKPASEIIYLPLVLPCSPSWISISHQIGGFTLWKKSRGGGRCWQKLILSAVTCETKYHQDKKFQWIHRNRALSCSFLFFFLRVIFSLLSFISNFVSPAEHAGALFMPPSELPSLFSVFEFLYCCGSFQHCQVCLFVETNVSGPQKFILTFHWPVSTIRTVSHCLQII